MNKIFRGRLGVMAATFLTGFAACGASVLSNPGFEYTPGLTGWTGYGPNVYNETGADAHSGTNYFKIYQSFSGSVNYSGIYQDYISGPGAAYTADGWAKTLPTDILAGQNLAWIEVTFRDANANILALYRSSLINTNAIRSGQFPAGTWIDLPVTNQYNPNTYTITNAARTLVAPAGTYFVRYQIVLQGDAANSNGSVYFDDLNLNPLGSSAYGNWNIVWSDEFNGTSINPNVWTYDTGAGGWGNNELEYYTSRSINSYVSGGLLHIVALKESYGGQSFTSARMKTQGLASWLYGRFEWRAKLPAGNGFWPALWFLGTNITSVGWPGCGEMDVMENSGSALGQVQGSLHSGSDETGFYYFPSGDSVTNFHTYVLDWSTNAFLFYVDGHLYETQTGWSSSIGSYPAPFNQPCFIIMNLAVGGNYVGNPSTATISTNGGFPGDMQVDYVRVYNMTAPLAISLVQTNNNTLLSWPSNIVCHLQGQFNPAGTGLGTNWSDLSGISNAAQLNLTNVTAFYRLKSP